MKMEMKMEKDLKKERESPLGRLTPLRPCLHVRAYYLLCTHR